MRKSPVCQLTRDFIWWFIWRHADSMVSSGLSQHRCRVGLIATQTTCTLIAALFIKGVWHHLHPYGYFLGWLIAMAFIRSLQGLTGRLGVMPVFRQFARFGHSLTTLWQNVSHRLTVWLWLTFFDWVSLPAGGLASLSDLFKTCRPFPNGDFIYEFTKDYLVTLAMANYPYGASFLGTLPAWPVKVCSLGFRISYLKYIPFRVNSRSETIITPIK